MTTIERLIACLPDDLRLDEPVTPETTFESLGMDSLDFVYFLSDVQSKFLVEIPNREAKHMRTAGDVATWLERNVCQPSPKH